MRISDWSSDVCSSYLGHVLITLPFVILVVQARLAGMRTDYEEAARSLGANAVQTFFAVTLPLMLPAVLAGMVFAFTISFDDITATLFWKSAGTETIPTEIFAMLRNSIRSEEHTSELQSLMRTSYAVFCLKKKKKQRT